MSHEVILTRARIVTPKEVFEGTLLVRRGLIEAVDTGRSHLPQAIDLEGDFLLPGLIELHTDHLETHVVPRPGVRWPPLAAILSHDAAVVTAGITTVFDALAIGDLVENSTRMRDLDEMMSAVLAAQERGFLRADHLLHLRCEVGYPHTLEIFERLVPHPLVKLVSLMDHTPGQRQFTSLAKMVQYYQGRYGLSDEEMRRLIETRQSNQRLYASRHRKAILGLCKERQLPVASHDDTTSEHVAEAASEGIVLCEFPTTIEAAKAARSFGLRILMGAPNLILGGSHSGNVSARELGKRGLLDLLSSDYVPSSLLHGAYLLYQELGLSLPEAVATVTLHPAQVSDLRDRGAIEEGKRADLLQVRWEPPIPVIKGVWKRGLKIF
ncbi:MAG: alpha-D-ribose 1-methylphosphonate 5-triphosphate diphosphatase [Desulfobacterota bacterium]|nr:alpha-D-ribose 1-methylphosphonate 5-triphosphate diphosphatase [Thermodesulfobacteriota bacterium]